MISNIPNETTYGSLLNNKKLTDTILKYMVESDGNLNYEYANASECNIVFITGKNEVERDLPLWEIPFVIKDIKGNNVVVTDLRKYVKKSSDDLVNLNDIVKDEASFKFLVLETLVISDLVSENYGEFIPIEKNIVTAATMWLSNSITATVLLNPVEQLKIELVIASYFYRMFMNGFIDSGIIKVKVSKTKLSIPTTLSSVEGVLSDLDLDVKDFKDLVNNIKQVLNEDRGELIDDNVVLTAVGGTWYGPGSNETVMVALESLPLLISLVYAGVAIKTYKRSRLSTILDKNSRKIGHKDIVKIMNLYLENAKF